MKLLFSGPCAVYLQGDNALTISGIFNKYMKDEYAGFLLEGFKDPLVSIRDYRKCGVDALRYVMETGDVTQFSNIFCTPAQVEAFQEDDGNIIVELFDTDDSGSKFCLWMPVGMENKVPNYDYVVEEFAWMEDQQDFAGFFIYKRHHHQHRKEIQTRRK